MSAQMTTEILKEVLDGATPHELLRFAELCRSVYVEEIANTNATLDPKRLRALDAKIAEFKAALN